MKALKSRLKRQFARSPSVAKAVNLSRTGSNTVVEDCALLRLPMLVHANLALFLDARQISALSSTCRTMNAILVSLLRWRVLGSLVDPCPTLPGLSIDILLSSPSARSDEDQENRPWQPSPPAPCGSLAVPTGLPATWEVLVSLLQSRWAALHVLLEIRRGIDNVARLPRARRNPLVQWVPPYSTTLSSSPSSSPHPSVTSTTIHPLNVPRPMPHIGDPGRLRIRGRLLSSGVTPDSHVFFVEGRYALSLTTAVSVGRADFDAVQRLRSQSFRPAARTVRQFLQEPLSLGFLEHAVGAPAVVGGSCGRTDCSMGHSGVVARRRLLSEMWAFVGMGKAYEMAAGRGIVPAFWGPAMQINFGLFVWSSTASPSTHAWPPPELVGLDGSRDRFVVPVFCYQHRLSRDAFDAVSTGDALRQLWHTHSLEALEGDHVVFRLCLQLIGYDEPYTAPVAPRSLLNFFESARIISGVKPPGAFLPRVVYYR